MLNWKLRLKNKSTLSAIIATIITFIYQFLHLIGVPPPVTQTAIFDVIMLFVDIMVLVGVVVDPTTKGISDSPGVMGYEEPR